MDDEEKKEEEVELNSEGQPVITHFIQPKDCLLDVIFELK